MGAAALSKLKPYLATQNVRLIGIGADREGFDDFVRGGFFKNGDALYLDPTRKIYRALGLAENGCCNGCFGIFGSRSQISKYLSMSQKKGFINNLRGDMTLMGGHFALQRGGEQAYAHYQTTEDMEPNHRQMCQSLGVTLPENYDPYEGIDPS